MNQNIQHHSNAWVTFTYASFGTSAFLVAIGVYFLPVDLWIQVGNKMVPPSLYSQIPIAVIGALCTGVCSLLSHNRRSQKI